MEPVSFIQKYKIRKLVKAMQSKPRPGANLSLYENRGIKPQGGGAAAPKAGGTNTREFPLHTVRNGRKKVNMHPPKWVDVSTGHSYDTHDAPHNEYHKVVDHDELNKFKEKLTEGLKDQISKKDLNHADKLAERYLQAKLQYKNLFRVTNLESSRVGAVPKEHQESTYKANEQAESYRQDFINFVTKAKRRAKIGK